MPAFNVVNFVGEAVESVLAQSFEGFELIVVDDGSTDGTGEALIPYADHPAVQILQNETNRGSGAARNRILAMARGEYFLPCDADDLLLPGSLQTLCRFLDDNLEVGVVYGDILRLETEAQTLLGAPSIVGRDTDQVWDLFENAVNHGGSLIRSDLMRRVGGYPVDPGPDDWGLFLKLAEITAIHYLEGQLYYVWRLHEGSQSRQLTNIQAAEQQIRAAIERRAERTRGPGPIVPESA